MLVGSTLLWGLSFPLIRGLELAQGAHAPGMAYPALACADMAWRFLPAAFFLAPFYGRQALAATRPEWSQATGLAFLGGAGLYLQTLGLSHIDASVSAFLTQLYTLLVPLFVACRLRRWPTPRTTAACLLVLLGVALLSPGLLAHLRPAFGELLILLSTVFIAGQILWVERPLYASNRAGPVTLLMFAQMGLFFALLFFARGGTTAEAARLAGTPVLGLLLLATVLLCTVMTFYIMNRWQRWITATEAGLIYCLEPVVAAIVSSFLPGWISAWAGVAYPNESPGWNLLAGGTLIVGATILVATDKKPLLASI